MRNKKNQTQTIRPSPSKLNRPEASMIPILKPPSNYLLSNDEVPIQNSNSNSETNQLISQLDNDSSGDKATYQFPLKEYTQEILNMTKFTKNENSSSTYFPPEDLYKPSILQQPSKIYNKTISKFSNSNSPGTKSRPNNSEQNNSYFVSQSGFSSQSGNALNFTINEEKLRPISFLEKVKKLKAKKKQNAASKPVHYQSYGSKTSITQSPYKISLSEDSTNESPGIISITTESPLHISSEDYKYSVTTDRNHPGAIQVTVR